ncbi:MAG: YtxH domain-containing protein [Bacteroidota bacterium]
MARGVRSGAWGVLIGGAVGFGLGLLLAPEKGERMRRRLIYQVDRLADQLADSVNTLLDDEAISDARRSGDALVADAEAKAQRIRDDIDNLLSEMRRQGRKTSN